MKRQVDGITITYEKLTQWWVFKSVTGITINQRIYIRGSATESILRHEYIHLLQQKELGNFKFYFLYLLFWLKGFISFEQAYRSISFEREAYANQRTKGYLTNRPNKAYKNY